MEPLSYSQISTYQSCPLSYKLQYIDKLKPRERWYFSFGSTIHTCAEFFFGVRVPPPPSLEELLRYYDDNWISAGYESPEEEQKYKAYGRDILTQFWQAHAPGFKMPFAVERLFIIDIEGVKLRGYIDRIDKLESGGLSIVDYKTNQEPFSLAHLADNLQLTLYHLAAEQTWQLPVEKLTLYHLRSNTPFSCCGRTPAQLEDARQLVLEVAEQIAAGKFPATENQYCPCDFPEHCPYHRHEFMTAVPDSCEKAIMPGLEAEAVERYVLLQAQIKELESQLEELRQVIISFCQAEELNRVFGNEHAITYKMIEKSGYDEAQVKAILEPLGLWDRVLSFDAARLEKLLAEESVANSVRRRLQELKCVLSTYPRLSVKKREAEK